MKKHYSIFFALTILMHMVASGLYASNYGCSISCKSSQNILPAVQFELINGFEENDDEAFSTFLELTPKVLVPSSPNPTPAAYRLSGSTPINRPLYLKHQVLLI